MSEVASRSGQLREREPSSGRGRTRFIATCAASTTALVVPLGRPAPRSSPARATILLLIVAGLVVVAAMLGYEAHSASKAQRRTVERALHDYVATAAWEFESSVRKAIDAEALRAFGVVTAGRAVTPHDPPVTLAQLRETADGALACAEGTGGTGDAERRYARLDLATSALVTDPPVMTPEARARIDAALSTVRAALPPADRPVTLAWPDASGGRVVLVATRYARLEAPVALYAIDACASALRTRIPSLVAAGRRLVPESLAEGVASDSLVALAIVGDDGVATFRAGAMADGGPRTASRLAWLGGATLEVALRPDAVRHLLLVPTEPSRVPLLIGLLALIALLAAVTVVQLRREQVLSRLQADFTSSVSHELRTPLAQILLFGETLSLERTRTADERRAAAQTIVREARRLMQLVDNILQFAQLRKGGPVLHLATLPVSAVVRDVVDGFTALAASRGARLAFAGEDALLVRADREALRQVVLNLLDNATKYGKREQLVRVSVAQVDGAVTIAVDDEGGGIAPPDRERIWHPYVRLGGRAGDAGGSGLGLAVVRELATAMSATVRVEDAPSGGARFVVAFAAVEQAAEQVVDPAHEGSAAPAAVATVALPRGSR